MLGEAKNLKKIWKEQKESISLQSFEGIAQLV